MSFFLGILESSKISYIKCSDSYETIFDNFKECTDFNLLLKEFKIKSVPKHGYATIFAISCIKRKEMQEFINKKVNYLDLPLSLKLLNQFK